MTAVLSMCGLTFGVVLPFVTNDPYAYTSRGMVWLTARKYLADHYTIGLGSPSWSGLVSRGLLPQYAAYSTHNQWLDIVWVAGFVGAAGMVCIVVRMLRDEPSIAIAVLLPVIFLGISERIWGIAAFDTWSFAYLAALIAVPSRGRRSDALDVQHREGTFLTPAVR